MSAPNVPRRGVAVGASPASMIFNRWPRLDAGVGRKTWGLDAIGGHTPGQHAHTRPQPRSAVEYRDVAVIRRNGSVSDGYSTADRGWMSWGNTKPGVWSPVGAQTPGCVNIEARRASSLAAAGLSLQALNRCPNSRARGYFSALCYDCAVWFLWLAFYSLFL